MSNEQKREALRAAYWYINTSDAELEEIGKTRLDFLRLFHKHCPELPTAALDTPRQSTSCEINQQGIVVEILSKHLQNDAIDMQTICIEDLSKEIAAALIASQAKELKRFKDAVVILPEGAEPMVGDIVSARWGCVYTVSRSTDDDWESDTGSVQGHSTIAKIIQRDGKPVIYEQAINNQS